MLGFVTEELSEFVDDMLYYLERERDVDSEGEFGTQ